MNFARSLRRQYGHDGGRRRARRHDAHDQNPVTFTYGTRVLHLYHNVARNTSYTRQEALFYHGPTRHYPTRQLSINRLANEKRRDASHGSTHGSMCASMYMSMQHAKTVLLHLAASTNGRHDDRHRDCLYDHDSPIITTIITTNKGPGMATIVRAGARVVVDFSGHADGTRRGSASI